MPPLPRRTLLAPLLTAATAALLASPTAPAASATTPGVAVQDNSTTYALAVWNYEFQEAYDAARPDDPRPRHWTPALSGSYGSSTAVRVQSSGSTSPYSPMQADGREKNYVLRVADTSSSGGAAMRGRSLNATPGRTYAATAYLSPQTRTPASLYLEFVDKDGRRVGLTRQQTVLQSAEYYAQRRTSSSAAMPNLGVSVTGTAPAGTTTVRPLIYSSYTEVGTTLVSAVYAREDVPDAAYDPRLTGQVLFVSDYRLGSVSNVSQSLYPGRKQNSTDGVTGTRAVFNQLSNLAVPDPDLKMSTLQGTVIKDGTTYKMWFGGKRVGEEWSTYYTTSADGLRWDLTPQKVLDNVNVGGVLRNPSTTDPTKRFLMFGVEGTLNTAVAPSDTVSYRTYASPDGVTWKPLSGKGVLPFRDVASVSYDPVTRQFISSSKQASGSTRQMFMSTSGSFTTWATPRRALRADAYDPAGSQVYLGGAFRYGDQLLATPTIYTPGVDQRGVDGPMTPYLASSHDSIRFSRPVKRVPLIPYGKDGDLDDGMILPFSQPIVDGDTVRLYYSGWTDGHEDATRSARIFMAWWKKDRFASLDAVSGAVGTVTTKPVTASSGADLVVNSAPKDSTGGSVRVEVLDATTGAVLAPAQASSTVSGDTLGTAVRWNGRSFADLGLVGRPVTLRFTLENAKLYSFQVR